MEKMKPEIMVCQCSSMEHHVAYWIDGEDGQVYMNVYLSPLPFLQRVWAALKYIFGYRCKYGHWEEFVLGEEHVEDLLKIAKSLDPTKKVYFQSKGHDIA